MDADALALEPAVVVGPSTLIKKLFRNAAASPFSSLKKAGLLA